MATKIMMTLAPIAISVVGGSVAVDGLGEGVVSGVFCGVDDGLSEAVVVGVGLAEAL